MFGPAQPRLVSSSVRDLPALSVLKLNFRLIFCPILALNFNFRPNSLKLLLFHLNKSTHLSSRTNQAPFKYYISIFPLAWRIFLQSNPTILLVLHLFFACFQLNMIIPPQQINIYVLPLKSGPVQVLRQQILPNLAIALARPVFELQKCYLDENCSEFNQKSIAVLRTWLACLVQKLR